MDKNERLTTASLFLIIPAIMLIFSYYSFPYPLETSFVSFLQIPMFLGLGLLFIGFLISFFTKERIGDILKILGWFVFAFFWSTQPSTLYFSEGKDVFNAVVCVLGVYVLCYIAYHEWLSIKRNENISCINWIAGASSLAGLIYFGIERTVLNPILKDFVTEHSKDVLNLIIGNAFVETGTTNIYLDGEYAVTIIFACTAVQAMVIFVGMIGALPKIDLKRRIIGLFITLVPVYVLNLLRNAMVAFLVGKDITTFFWAHNVLSKIGALITLIVLLLIVIKIIPEILDEIFCLVDIYKRNGPIEKTITKIFGRKK